MQVYNTYQIKCEVTNRLCVRSSSVSPTNILRMYSTPQGAPWSLSPGWRVTEEGAFGGRLKVKGTAPLPNFFTSRSCPAPGANQAMSMWQGENQCSYRENALRNVIYCWIEIFVTHIQTFVFPSLIFLACSFFDAISIRHDFKGKIPGFERWLSRH